MLLSLLPLIMVNLFNKYLLTRVAEKYYTLKKLTSKSQRTAVNIGFIYKVINSHVVPKVKG